MTPFGTSVAGVGIHDKPCPKCKSAMYISGCGCTARRLKGWVMCAKCINPKCRMLIAIKTTALPKPRKKKRRI